MARLPCDYCVLVRLDSIYISCRPACSAVNPTSIMASYKVRYNVPRDIAKSRRSEIGGLNVRFTLKSDSRLGSSAWPTHWISGPWDFVRYYRECLMLDIHMYICAYIRKLAYTVSSHQRHYDVNVMNGTWTVLPIPNNQYWLFGIGIIRYIYCLADIALLSLIVKKNPEPVHVHSSHFWPLKTSPLCCGPLRYEIFVTEWT